MVMVLLAVQLVPTEQEVYTAVSDRLSCEIGYSYCPELCLAGISTPQHRPHEFASWLAGERHCGTSFLSRGLSSTRHGSLSSTAAQFRSKQLRL